MSRRAAGGLSEYSRYSLGVRFTMVSLVDIPVLNRIVSKVWSKSCKGEIDVNE